MPSPPTNALRPIPPIPPSFENQTVRMVVRPTIGGELLRIQFSNASGADPVRFAAVRIAKSLGDARIDPESDRRVTFSGEADVTIQPGAIAIRSEEHTSELQSLMRISYSVFCLKKKN